MSYTKETFIQHKIRLFKYWLHHVFQRIQYSKINNSLYFSFTWNTEKTYYYFHATITYEFHKILFPFLSNFPKNSFNKSCWFPNIFFLSFFLGIRNAFMGIFMSYYSLFYLRFRNGNNYFFFSKPIQKEFSHNSQNKNI